MADENNSPPEAEKPAKSGKMVLAVFAAVVVVAETAMFFFLVPSAEDVSALAEARLIKSIQKGEEQAQQQTDDENKQEEIDLGMFGETFSPTDTERSFRVEIRLYGLVSKKNLEKIKKEFEEKQGRLRHAIRMRIRNSELAELQDNQLGLLQRRILTTCNHLLDQDLLLGIGFHEYQLIEE